jgi:hypothetical protein
MCRPLEDTEKILRKDKRLKTGTKNLGKGDGRKSKDDSTKKKDLKFVSVFYKLQL